MKKERKRMLLYGAIALVLLGISLPQLISGVAERKQVIRVGYFPNITHAQALVGLADGTFQKYLGPKVEIEAKAFNAGPAAIEALLAGSIDITYVGPNPAINGYIRSQGKALRIIAGAASGGAALVVRKDVIIKSPKDWAGKRIASPQLGNTQDVALRIYLQKHGLKTKEKGGNVEVIPIANPDQLNLFRKKEIDAAWTVEPWVTWLVEETDGKIYLDERSLWPQGKFVTTHLVARTEFLRQHPELVEKWLAAHVELTQRIKENPEASFRTINKEIAKITNKEIPAPILTQASKRIDITYDPMQSSLYASAKAAYDLGFLGKTKPNLKGLYALQLLNKVLKARKLPLVR